MRTMLGRLARHLDGVPGAVRTQESWRCPAVATRAPGASHWWRPRSRVAEPCSTGPPVGQATDGSAAAPIHLVSPVGGDNGSSPPGQSATRLDRLDPRVTTSVDARTARELGSPGSRAAAPAPNQPPGSGWELAPTLESGLHGHDGRGRPRVRTAFAGAGRRPGSHPAGRGERHPRNCSVRSPLRLRRRLVQDNLAHFEVGGDRRPGKVPRCGIPTSESGQCHVAGEGRLPGLSPPHGGIAYCPGQRVDAGDRDVEHPSGGEPRGCRPQAGLNRTTAPMGAETEKGPGNCVGIVNIAKEPKGDVPPVRCRPLDAPAGGAGQRPQELYYRVRKVDRHEKAHGTSVPHPGLRLATRFSGRIWPEFGWLTLRSEGGSPQRPSDKLRIGSCARVKAVRVSSTESGASGDVATDQERRGMWRRTRTSIRTSSSPSSSGAARGLL